MKGKGGDGTWLEGEYRLTREGAFPESGFWYETFEEARYTPWMVHDWRVKVDPYRERIVQAFRKEKAAGPASDRAD
jgi:hypothetical protein